MLQWPGNCVLIFFGGPLLQQAVCKDRYGSLIQRVCFSTFVPFWDSCLKRLSRKIISYVTFRTIIQVWGLYGQWFRPVPSIHQSFRTKPFSYVYTLQRFAVAHTHWTYENLIMCFFITNLYSQYLWAYKILGLAINICPLPGEESSFSAHRSKKSPLHRISSKPYHK